MAELNQRCGAPCPAVQRGCYYGYLLLHEPAGEAPVDWVEGKATETTTLNLSSDLRAVQRPMEATAGPVVTEPALPPPPVMAGLEMG